MSKLSFKTSLSISEIGENFKDFDIFESLVDGLNEAISYEQGTAHSKTFARKRALPNVNITQVRNILCMTQKDFATVLGVSCRTVESWESGRSNPNPTAKNLIFLIQEDPSLVGKLLKKVKV